MRRKTFFISKSTRRPNFGEIFQSTAELLLLPVSENKRPPCWNSISGSDFYVCVTIGMSFCICLPNFVQIGPSATEILRHILYPRWRPQRRNSTFGFVFRDLAHWKGRNLPADQISARYFNPRLRYYYFRFLKTNVRHAASGCDFSVCVTIGMSFCICLPNFVQIGPSATEIWRHSGHNIEILLSVSVFVTSHIWEGRNLPAHQISAKMKQVGNLCDWRWGRSLHIFFITGRD